MGMQARRSTRRHQLLFDVTAVRALPGSRTGEVLTGRSAADDDEVKGVSVDAV